MEVFFLPSKTAQRRPVYFGMIPEALTIGRMVLSLRLLVLFASVSGGLLVVAEWKLTALLTQFESIRREPLLLLYASGGRAGIVVGALLAAGPLFIVLYTGTALHHMLTEGPAHAAARGRAALLRSLVE